MPWGATRFPINRQAVGHNVGPETRRTRVRRTAIAKIRGTIAFARATGPKHRRGTRWAAGTEEGQRLCARVKFDGHWLKRILEPQEPLTGGQ